MKQYIVTNEAWYAGAVPYDRGVTDEVVVQDAAEDGGVHWEFLICWHDLGGGSESPRVEIFDDAWRSFAEVPELFAALSERDGDALSVGAVCRLLRRLGFEDATERERRRS